MAAINALYRPVTAPVANPPASHAVVVDQTIGAFVAAPSFGTGRQALAVFDGGPIAMLEAATEAAGASGAWVQDARGGFALLVVGGPTFMRSTFAASFPNGFDKTIAVTLVR